ncbi:MAG: hypothetical protein ACOX1P_27620 [Thermoguttaceae bacterium]
MAEDVARVCAAHLGERRGQWRLELGADLAEADLRKMPVECQSGWASLAAGLIVAAHGGTPDWRVWATGCWDNRLGVTQVGLLKQKLDMAAEFGAKTVFVPADQAGEAASLVNGIQIGSLRMAERDPGRALAELTLCLEAPPPPPCSDEDEAGFDRCMAYYLRQPRGRPETTQYYWSHLLPTVTRRVRRQVLSEYPDWRPTHMATIVSGSPELVLLAARALDVGHCLVLYTPNMDPHGDQTDAMQMVKNLLEADGRECLPDAFEDSPLLEKQIPEAIRRFGQGQPSESLVLDITPGNKWMTWVADRAMPSGSWRLYIRNDTLTSADRRPRPGSEELRCWRAR